MEGSGKLIMLFLAAMMMKRQTVVISAAIALPPPGFRPRVFPLSQTPAAERVA
jgi:hypothetical protein